MVGEWWELQNPKPTGVGRETLARRVEKLVNAGWPRELIPDALDQCQNFTEAAIEGRLRGLRATGTGGGGGQRPLEAMRGLSVAPGYVLGRPHPDDCGGGCGGSGWVETDEGAVRCSHGA